MLNKEQYHVRIREMEKTERPRERLIAHGAEVLSNAELIAILLRVGTRGVNVVNLSQNLLQQFHGLAGIQRCAFKDLCRVNGMGEAKACQLKAAIELGRRLTVERPEDRPTIHSPEEAADLVQYEMSALEQEELWILLLDIRNHYLRIEKLYRGSLNASTVRIAELFKSAIRWNAASMIVFHNHPSGDPSESPEDVQMTRNLVRAGKLLELEVLDHIIIGGSRHLSLKKTHPDLWA